MLGMTAQELKSGLVGVGSRAVNDGPRRSSTGPVHAPNSSCVRSAPDAAPSMTALNIRPE